MNEQFSFGMVVTLVIIGFVFWFDMIVSAIDHTRNKHCIDAGGVPVYFYQYTKDVGEGDKCITDYKIVEPKS